MVFGVLTITVFLDTSLEVLNSEVRLPLVSGPVFGLRLQAHRFGYPSRRHTSPTVTPYELVFSLDLSDPSSKTWPFP